MRCPLCGGPVDGDGKVAGDGDGLQADRPGTADQEYHRLSEALWMAVQALDNEADTLRALAAGEGRQFADEAEEQARLLRNFAQRHSLRSDRDRDAR